VRGFGAGEPLVRRSVLETIYLYKSMACDLGLQYNLVEK